MNTRIVAALLRLYPKAWRDEYGGELSDMLLARPLTTGVCVDVVRSAMWQRVRIVGLATWVGIGLMLVTIGAIVSNIAAPPPHVWLPGLARGAQPAFSQDIALLQRPLHSEFYAIVLAGLGFWTAVRGGHRSGRAAIRVSTIASLPLVIVGALMLVGVLEFTELSAGQTSPAFAERGILYTFYTGFQQIPGPAPIVMLLSPLLRLPGAWMWGAIGGAIGRQFNAWRRRAVSA